MNESLFIIILLGVAVCWAVLLDARSRKTMERDHAKREREDAAEKLRIKQMARYITMKRTGTHIHDRDVSAWASSAHKAPSLQKRATLTVLKGAKR